MKVPALFIAASQYGCIPRTSGSRSCRSCLRGRVLGWAQRFVLLLICFFPTITFGQPAQSPDPPNIILVFMDDLGYGDVGAYGAQGIFTPNIDRLAQEGVRFTDFYSAPVCGPSRAMLLTGSYAPRVSLNRNHIWSANTGIHSDEITLGELLRGAGYVTGIFGKWHLGDHYQFRPQRHGFDEFFGIPYSNDMWPFHPRNVESVDEDPRTTAARERAELTGYPGQNDPTPRGQESSNLPLYDGDTIVEFNSDQTLFGSIFIDRALDFIERNQTNRFFVYLPLTAPHVPLHPSAAFVGTSARDLYGDTVQEADSGIGRLMTKLVELGIDEQTLIIFISDNGPWLEYGIDGGSAGILSGGKGTQMEGGIRVPAMMRWPGQLSPGTIVDEVASTIDILPTLAGLVGESLPANRVIDGVDIWPLLVDPTVGPQHEAYFGFNEADFADIKLGAIRSGKWKLHVSTRSGGVNPVALYDLESDIGETNDIRSSQPNVVAAMLDLGIDIINDIKNNQRPLGQVILSGEPFTQKRGAGGGLIVIETEHFHERQANAGHDWQIVNVDGDSAEGSVQALPNSGTKRNSNYATTSPHLGYRAIFETPGRYYVWVRGWGQSDSDDSLHIGLDGQPVASGFRLSEIFDYWTWSSTLMGGGRSFIDVQTAGEHVIDVWMREDGLILDKLVLTADPDFEPFGKGPVESRQSFDGLAVPPTALDDGPFVIDEGGSVAGNPNVLDNDFDPRNDPMTAALVSGPASATPDFVLSPDGTFDYTHNGSGTTSDSFTYTANDADGSSNEAVVTITIIPVDDPPVIRLLGDATVNITVGDTYIDAGATAQDEEDGDLTASIVVDNPVDANTVGTYTVTYNVTDSGSNAADTVIRTVTVQNPPPPPRKSGGGIMGVFSLLLLLGFAAWRRFRAGPQYLLHIAW